jgi:hypothetical protein
VSFKKRLKQFDRRKMQLEREIRKVLPVFRGGTGPGRPQSERRTPTRRPQPLVKTYQHTPTIPENPFVGDLRWVPTAPHPNARPQEMIEMTRREEDDLQRELQDLFDQLPTEGEQELAYLDLREENQRGAQNQTLENALARMAADRPRQFQIRARSRSPFTRANLLRAPKKKRKVSKYSKQFGIELKKLKKLHPRTKIQNLMKKAHRRTKAAMKK